MRIPPVLCYNFKRKIDFKGRKEGKLCQGALSWLFSTNRNSQRYQMGYPCSHCTCNIFSSVSTHVAELCGQPGQVLILRKTIPFSFLGLIFLLSFGCLSNHKNMSVYRRKVVGLCNWRTRRVCHIDKSMVSGQFWEWNYSLG